MKISKIKVLAPRKKLWYIISLSGDFWWIKGKNIPVKGDSPLIKKFGASNNRYCQTKKKAFRLFNNCPVGTIVSRMLSCRTGKYLLMEWEKLR